MEQSVSDIAKELRAQLLEIENRIRALREHSSYSDTKQQTYVGQHGEMLDQSMLALRAVEEARMRLGKVMQYARGGESIYDRAVDTAP